MTNYFTREGYTKYQSKIANLNEVLEEMQSHIQDYAETGGNLWHDNFSFEQMRRQIGDVSNNLRKMTGVLNDCKIIDLPDSVDSVVIGCEVSLLRNGNNEKYAILGYDESSPKEGKIAYNTPFAQFLMGKTNGYKGEFRNGSLCQTIEIINVGSLIK